MRDALIAWVANACAVPEAMLEVVDFVDAATQRGSNCYFRMGAALTKRGTPCLVHCFDHEMFVFDLTPDQANSIRLENGQLIKHISGPSYRPKPGTRRPVKLERPRITCADCLDGGGLVEGFVAYTSPWNQMLPCALRLAYHLPHRGRRVQWFPLPEALEPAGVLRFRFRPINADVARPYSGTLALFFNLCSGTDSEPYADWRLVSNTRAVLVDVQ